MPKYSVKRTAQRHNRRVNRRRARAFRGRGLMHQPGVNQIHAYKRSFVSAIQTTAGVYGGGFIFSLATMPNSSEFTALYDLYRIRKCVVRIVFRSTTISAIETRDNNVAGMPILYYVKDKDDATTPASASEIMEYSAHKIFFYTPSKRSCSITVYPTWTQEVFRTGVTTGYGLGPRKTWLDAAYSNIEHYGLKMYLSLPQGAGTAVNGYFDIHTTVYLECKDAR